MTSTRVKGSFYEAKAASYLERLGYRILAMNYRCRLGEIDLIAKHENYLTFIEVKYRRSDSQGSPFEAVTYRKQQTIYKTAQYYMQSHRILQDTPCRFDVVAVSGEPDGENEAIEVIQNAFGGV